MEENQLPPETAPDTTPSPPGCAGCGNPNIVEGYATPLCTDCRNTYNRYPVPKWIWLVTGIIGVMLLVSLVRLPAQFSTIVHLRKAEKAVAAHNYHTAFNEAAIVLKKNPDHLEANAYSLISAVYNMDAVPMLSAYKKLENQKIEDKELFKQLEQAIDRASILYFSDSAVIAQADTVSLLTPAVQLLYVDSLIQTDMDPVNKTGFVMTLSNYLIDAKMHREAVSMLEKLEMIPAADYARLYGQISPRRQYGDIEGALKICRQLLEENHEDVGVLAQQAKVEIAQQHYKEADELAAKALALEPDQLTALEARALVYHFNGKKDDSKKMLTRILALEAPAGDSTVYLRLSQILNGTTVYH